VVVADIGFGESRTDVETTEQWMAQDHRWPFLPGGVLHDSPARMLQRASLAPRETLARRSDIASVTIHLRSPCPLIVPAIIGRRTVAAD
jgi:hypothetical protein